MTPTDLHPAQHSPFRGRVYEHLAGLHVIKAGKYVEQVGEVGHKKRVASASYSLRLRV